MDILLAAALVLSVIGIKIAPKNTLWSADGLSMDDSNSLRGMLSVFIVLHHLAILTGAGYSAYFVKRIGHLIVAAFLAMSGYGILYSYRSSGCSVKGFWQKRLFRLIIPYLVISVVYAFVRSALGEEVTVSSFFLSFVNGKTMVKYSWYIIATLVFYAMFWLSAKLIKENIPLLIMTVWLLATVYIFAMMKLDYDEYWYNVVWAFPLGMLWQYAYGHIARALKKHTWAWLLMLLMMFGVFYLSSSYLYVTKLGGLLITGCLFAVFIMAAMFKLSWGKRNPVLGFLGKISLEIYMLHGLFVLIFSKVEWLFERPLALGAAVLVCTVLAAWLVNRAFSSLQKSITAGRREV